MAREYAVLRNMSLSSTAEPFAARAFDTQAAKAVPVPKVEVETLDAVGVRDIAREPDVVSVAPLMPTKLVEAVQFQNQAAATAAWGIKAVGADVSPFTGAGVVVAVLDTGIASGHPAFKGVTLVEQDFTGGGNGDNHGHGTHCAGTIFGRDVGGTRIGVARGVSRALIGKVLDVKPGSTKANGTSDMIFRGIQWAVQSGAHVVSMSLGFDFPGLVEELEGKGWPTDLAVSAALEGYRGNLRMFDALMQMTQAQAAFSHSAVIVAAAGNESRRNVDPDYEIAVSLPAAAEGVISVGALGEGTNGLQIAYFSNTFPQICAPGVNVLSAHKAGGTIAMNGTSMACPHVAGVAALWWEAVHAQGLPETAATVTARLLGRAATGGIDPGVDIADRGVGLVAAP